MPEDIHAAGLIGSEEDVDHRDLEVSITLAAYWPWEGLFIHTFQGMACSLEFALFSWWPDRAPWGDTSVDPWA